MRSVSTDRDERARRSRSRSVLDSESAGTVAAGREARFADDLVGKPRMVALDTGVEDGDGLARTVVTLAPCRVCLVFVEVPPSVARGPGPRSLWRYCLRREAERHRHVFGDRDHVG